MHVAPRQYSTVFVNAVAILYILFLSSAFVAIKIGLRYWPPMLLAGVRFLIAALVTGAIARTVGVSWPRDPRSMFRLVCLGSLNMILPACFNFLALQRVSAGMAAIVLSTNPLLLTLLAPWLLREKMTWSRAAGILCGFGGVVWVMIVRVGAGGRTDTPGGVALLGLAALSMVGGTVFFKRFPPRENLWVINTVQQAVGGLLLIPISFGVENPLSSARPTLPLFAALFYMALVVSVGAGLLWFWLLGRGEASAVSAFYFLSPLSGLLLGALLTGEHFGVREASGLVVVCLGIVLIRGRGKTAPPAVAQPKVRALARPPSPPPEEEEDAVPKGEEPVP